MKYHIYTKEKGLIETDDITNEIKRLIWHREDGPAAIRYYENGQRSHEAWFLNDKRHREDEPAVIKYYENGQRSHEAWFLNDKLHREDGPAEIGYNKENGQKSYETWFLNGKRYSFEDWNKSKQLRKAKLKLI